MRNKKLIYAIIPARSGSKGLPDKNIKIIKGKPLISYSINFAKKLDVDRIICSTDSEQYAEIAKKHGAEVPFLRSIQASSDNSMEEDILTDLYNKFDEHSIPYPDLFVWLRPTFVFRDLESVKKCIDKLLTTNYYSSARTVCESEARLYKLNDELLTADFDDKNKSMIRRQEVQKLYKVFNTDVFRGKPKNSNSAFLGSHVLGVEIPKICGLDIDDAEDFKIVEAIVEKYEGAEKYLFR